MSVIVKGMEMPYGCANCDFASSPIHDSKGYANYFCHVPVDGIRGNNITDQVIDMYEGGVKDTFPEWCPLVEVKTPHGRLIDADELMNESRKDGAYGYVDTKQIYDAPAVIEAEGEP